MGLRMSTVYVWTVVNVNSTNLWVLDTFYLQVGARLYLPFSVWEKEY